MTRKQMEFYSLVGHRTENSHVWEELEEDECEEPLLELLVFHRIIEGQFPVSVEGIDNFDINDFTGAFNGEEKEYAKKELEKNVRELYTSWEECEKRYTRISLINHNLDSIGVLFQRNLVIEDKRNLECKKKWIILYTNNLNYETKYIETEMVLLNQNGKELLTKEDFRGMFEK